MTDQNTAPAQAPKQAQSPTEKLRADYTNQLNGVNSQLQQLEQQKNGLVAYREQLKGAIFALDQLANLQNAQAAEAAAPAAAPETETKAPEAAPESAGQAADASLN